MIPARAGLRIVGDVHGDTRAFAHAIATDRFVVQLGDLVDEGPDSVGALRMAFALIDEGRGLFLLGNHDRKLGRALAGESVHVDARLATTLRQLDDATRARAHAEIARAPAWLRQGHRFFVHAGFHTDMLASAPSAGLGRVDHVLSRALFGETTGKMQPDGYPVRRIRWVNHIPAGMTVFCGHDRRSTDGRPYRIAGREGGVAMFMDTGAGKGGHLSWVDVDPE